MSERHFGPEVFRFLKDLQNNNNRDWFKENKDRFETVVREPALKFIVDFGAHLPKVSPHFLTDPRRTGGSLYRIYRDVRFSKNKLPYKTHAGIHFRHENGKDAYTPGFYLHMEPGANFIGLGLWHPDRPSLTLIRDAIVAEPDVWVDAISNKKFKKSFKIAGDSLKRGPKGYDPEHPLIESLKMKDFTAFKPLTQKQITSDGFIDEFAELCADGSSLVKFICRALNQPF